MEVKAKADVRRYKKSVIYASVLIFFLHMSEKCINFAGKRNALLWFWQFLCTNFFSCEICLNNINTFFSHQEHYANEAIFSFVSKKNKNIPLKNCIYQKIILSLQPKLHCITRCITKGYSKNISQFIWPIRDTDWAIIANNNPISAIGQTNEVYS